MSTASSLHGFRISIAGAVLFALLGCVAPESNDPGVPATAAADEAERGNIALEATPGPPRRAPPMSDPLPPQRVVEPAAPPASIPATGTVKVDTSCRTSADCTVKNVGNCCGEYPACVNVNSPTDPEGVQAECAAKGMASVCGFPAITGCQCVAGQCTSDNGAVAR